MTNGKAPLSISFHNFHDAFRPRKSFFASALSQVYDLDIVSAGRDVQISSVFGRELLPVVPAGRPLRVWWTGEARDPQHQSFDLYFGFRHAMPLLGGAWHRYPLWITYLDWWDETSPYHVGHLLAPRQPGERSRFCNFIYSAPATLRAEFFMQLDAARGVDSLGRLLNNTTDSPPRGRRSKLEILEQSLFTIAFENQIAEGYVTEKLLEPLLAGSIPIYWGTADAARDFNPDAFIDATAFDTVDALVRHVLEIADAPERYEALATAPPFRDNVIPERFRPDYFVDRISEALGSAGPRPWERREWVQPSRAFGKRVEDRLRTMRRAWARLLRRV